MSPTEIIPSPGALMSALRSTGYTLNTAIADLIDNSISAKASQVDIDCQWNGAKSWISIRDNGLGMDQEKLIEAMRLGGNGPEKTRVVGDLGRFGLGLKTACLSQCRRFTVATRSAGARRQEVMRWDLDHISRTQRWEVLDAFSNETADAAKLDLISEGTAVLLECLDRVVADGIESSNQKTHDQFLKKVELLKRHLALVFHRFLETEQPRIRIFINGNRIASSDPFLTKNSATRAFPETSIFVGAKKIQVKGYVLPHPRLVGADDLGAHAIDGWSQHQGFYIYRCDRLIIAGDWLGLSGLKKEEHFKLARIKLDVDNSQDNLWSIDVKKSRAWPPDEAEDDLRNVANKVRFAALEAFRRRGAREIVRSNVNQSELSIFWKLLESSTGDRVVKINREYPSIKALAKICAEIPGGLDVLSSVLQIAEETLPLQEIWLNANVAGNITKQPLRQIEVEERIEMIRQLLSGLKSLWPGATLKELKAIVATMEPFSEMRDLLDSYADDGKNDE